MRYLIIVAALSLAACAAPTPQQPAAAPALTPGAVAGAQAKSRRTYVPKPTRTPGSALSLRPDGRPA